MKENDLSSGQGARDGNSSIGSLDDEVDRLFLSFVDFLQELSSFARAKMAASHARLYSNY